MQRKYEGNGTEKKLLMKLPQNLELDVYVCVEFDFAVNIRVHSLLEADASIFYPLNRVGYRFIRV